MSEMIPSMAKLFERENLSYRSMLINECSPQLTPNRQATIAEGRIEHNNIYLGIQDWLFSRPDQENLYNIV